MGEGRLRLQVDSTTNAQIRENARGGAKSFVVNEMQASRKCGGWYGVSLFFPFPEEEGAEEESQ